MIITPKYPTKIGVELTFNAPIFIDLIRTIYSPGEVKILKKYFGSTVKDIEQIYIDCKYFEVVSKPLRDHKKLIDIYKGTDKYANFLQGSIYDDSVSGGGLHINLDYPNGVNKITFDRYFYYEINKHPYLNWALNSPWDDENAECKFLTKNCWGNSLECDMEYILNGRDFYTSKSDMINYQSTYDGRRGYIEFRFFDNPRNLKEYIAFINIALKLRDKYTDQWIKLKNKRSFKPSKEEIKIIKNNLEKMEKDEAWEKFCRLINELKLPDGLPMKNWKNNIDTRFQLIKDKEIKKV